MPRTDDVEYQAYPRACALVELTWTAQAQRNATADAFMERLAKHGARLAALGLNYRHVQVPATTARWTPESLGGKWEIALSDDLAKRIARGEKLTADFAYQSGANGLSIASVELLANGKTVAKDAHAGFASGVPRDTLYTLSPGAAAKTGRLSVHIVASGEGDDSSGEVAISTHP